MRSIFLYLLAVALVLTACEMKPEKVKHVIVRKTVFAIQDTLYADPQLPLRHSDTSYIEFVFKHYDLADVQHMDSSIRVNLRYADTNNFLRRNFYDGLTRAYFTCEMATKLCNAQYFLRELNPQYSLIIFDGSRPQHIQQMMWDSLKLPPLTKLNYLSKPEETSLHNYGCAVDLSIFDERKGQELDMGTGYDTFLKLSEPMYEFQFLRSGELSHEAYENRKLLRLVMKKAGLNPINTEWWHFSSCSKDEAIKRFPLIR